jgi:iron complex outermembrane receptor protein
MRITLAMAVACLVQGGLAAADDARAAIRKPTYIPAEGLGPALNALAKDRNFQIVYVTEEVANVRTEGAVGEFTIEEALKMLLTGTGLTYRYLDDKTVTIGSATSPHDGSGRASKTTAGGSSDDANATKEGKEISSGGVRTAQTRQGSVSSASPPAAYSYAVKGEGLEEIVVTAQKREERLRDVPISISVLSGDDLDRSTSQGVSEELNRVPGVVIPPASLIGVSQIAVRGVAASGIQWAGASPVAYYLDTVPFGFVRSAYIPDSGTFDLARVEVLRGPQGTLYGANAEDGVVRIIPNDADPNGFDLKARTFLSGTNSGGVNGSGDLAVNVPVIDGKLAVRGVIGYQDLSGWIDRPTERDANDAQLRNYRLRVAYHPTDALSIDLSVWSSRDHFGAPPNSLPDRTAPNTGTTSEPIDTDFDAYGAKINYQFAHVSVTSMSSYLDFSTANEINLTPYGQFYDGLNLHNRATSDIFSEEILLNSTDARPWRWTAGAFYRDERDVNDQFAAPRDVGATFFNDKSRSYAVFGQLGRLFLQDKFEWTLGVRQYHDDVSTLKTDPTPPTSYLAESFNATTPRAVLSWYPNTNMTVYSSFSEGFRSGMPQYYTIAEIAPSLPAVKPDKLYNYEVGTKAALLDNHLEIDTAVYYVNWRDVQESILVNLPGGGQTQAQVNGSSASGPGFDIAVITRPTENWQVGGTFSWNRLKLDSVVFSAGQILFSKGDRLNNSSEYTGSLFATYKCQLGRGTSGELSVSGNYTSKQATHGIDGNGFAYVNYGDNLFFAQAAFTATFPKNWSLKLFGDNLTNQYGAIYGPPVGYASTTDQFAPRPRPRTIGLEVDYRYR